MAKCYTDKRTGIFYNENGIINLKEIEINQHYIIVILDENYYITDGIVRIDKVTFSNEIMLLNALVPITFIDEHNMAFNVYGDTLEERLMYFEDNSLGKVIVTTGYVEEHKCVVLKFIDQDTIERVKNITSNNKKVYFELLYTNNDEDNSTVIAGINIKIEYNEYSLTDFINNLFLTISYVKEILSTESNYKQGIYNIPFEQCKEALVFLVNSYSLLNKNHKRDDLMLYLETIETVPDNLNVILGVNYSELYKLIILNKK